MLVDSGFYPQWKQLNDLFNIHRITEFDVPTVMKLVNGFLQRALPFEQKHRFYDILFEKLETVPDISRLARHDELQANLERFFVIVAYLFKHSPPHSSGHWLFISEVPDRTIKVRTYVQIVEHKRQDFPELNNPPELLEGDVAICDSIHSFVQCLDPSALIIGAQDDSGLELAVKIKLFQQANVSGKLVDWNRVNVPVIGSKFRESCQSVCASQAASFPKKILQSIVEIVDKFNLEKTHAIRTGKGGNNPQQKRGSHQAQRHDIDHSFRLHYWKKDRGMIELASVNYHNDVKIPK